MNIVKLQDDLKSVPDQSLVGYVQNPSGQVPSYLALSELQRRKQMRERVQSNQGQGQQPSVAEQLVAETQPQAPQGIAGIPVSNVGSEEAYAAGGIIAFEDGGDVQSYASKGEVEESILNKSLYEEYIKPWYLRNQEKQKKYAVPMPKAARRLQEDTGVQSLAPASASPMVMAPEQPNQAQLMANMGAAKLRAGQAAGQYKESDLYGGIVENKFRPPAPAPAPAPAPVAVDPLGAMQAPNINYTPMTASDMTPAGDSRASMQEYQNLIGADPYTTKAKERIGTMEQANELYKQQYPWMALAEAGFGMAAGKSSFALSNIAEGGMKGVAALGAGRKELRDQQEKVINAEAKVAEAERATQLKAAEFGVNDSRTKEAARRLEKAEDRKNKLAVETRNEELKYDFTKFGVTEARARQSAADEKEYRTKSLKLQREIGNKTPAEIQLIERYAAARKIPFDQAFEEIQQGKNEPKSDIAIGKMLVTLDSTLLEDPKKLADAVYNYKQAFSKTDYSGWGSPKAK